MKDLDLKRIVVYLVVAFGFTWAVDLVIYLNGGLGGSPELIAGTGITLALALLTLSMFGPALGNVATRLTTGEGWRDVWLRPKFGRGWGYWLLVWGAIPLLITFGSVVYFLIFPQHFDPQSQFFRDLLAAQNVPEEMATLIILAQLGVGILISPIINAIPILGEEFGWRGYLLPKLLPLGERPAMVAVGVIWGLWHAPVLTLGYNYGSNYPGFPWTGILLFCWFTFIVGTLIGWATLRAGSVWPAVIGHGLINGLAAGPALFTQGQPNPLLGPAAIGLIGGLGFALAGLYIFVARLDMRRDLPKESDSALRLPGPEKG